MDSKKVYGPHEAVTLGIELENAGHNFYSRVAEAAADFRVKELFASLAKAEIEHMRVIREEIEPDFTPEWYREEDQELMAEYLRNIEKQPVFPSAEEAVEYVGSAGGAVKAIDIGIVAEKRSMAYFEYLRDATQDPKGKNAFDRLYHEEEKHLELLTELKKSM